MIEIERDTLDTIVHQVSETDLYRGNRRDDGAPVAVKLTQRYYPTFRELARLRREHAILRELRAPAPIDRSGAHLCEPRTAKKPADNTEETPIRGSSSNDLRTRRDRGRSGGRRSCEAAHWDPCKDLR